MGQLSLLNGLQYAGYALELSVLVLLLARNRIRRFPALSAYVAALFGVDAVGRGWVLQHYGATSAAYYYAYWLTDLLLALGVFLLVCSFFRRACQDHQEVWAFVRPTLTLVLVLVIVVSAVALRANFQNLFSSYIYEFNQDLYFVCLVLNTVLYLMLQRFRRGQDPLNLLVCGLGVQLAGPTAGIALVYLMGNQGVSRVVVVYLSSICFVVMMLIWSYAIARMPSEIPGTGSTGQTGRRRCLSSPIGLKPVTAGGRHHGIAADPNILQADNVCS
jgi:hypothetical protein